MLDAYALIFRAYYAFIGRPMRNSAGLNTSAIFGFTKFLRDIIIRERPHHLGVAFDPRGGNFRHQLFPAYKANRAATPEDIIASVPYIKRILEAMCIPVLEVPGWEADDVIGTLSVKASAAGYQTFMVTPDKDYGQLVAPYTYIYKQRKGGEGVDVLDSEAVNAQYGISDPRLVIDILALWGDASDNVPGVPGVGEKGAIKLVNQFGTVEDILAAADRDAIGGRIGENLRANRDQLLLSKRLVTIDTDAPVEFVPAELEMCDPDCAALRELYKELDFNAFLREMETNSRSPFSSAILCRESGAGMPAATATYSLESTSTTSVASSTPAPAPSSETGPIQGDLFSSAAAVVPENVAFETVNIHTSSDLQQTLQILTAAREVAFKIETSGRDYFRDRITGISFSVDPAKIYHFSPDTPLENTPSPSENALFSAPTPLKIDPLREIFENTSIAKIGHDLKSSAHFLHAAGIELRGQLLDTLIISYLLDPEAPRHTPRNASETLSLYNSLSQRFSPISGLYSEIEEPLIRVLESMEWEGIRVDTQILADYGHELTHKLAGLENQVREMTGEPALNVNSPAQLGEVLFVKMQLADKPKRTKTQKFSTGEEQLRAIAHKHPVIELILQYRGLKKLLSTYVEALPVLVNPRTGRIHTSYNQAVTATGRLSSTNPNLQNIPIREEQGRTIRRAFVPSDADHVLLSADYSQVELRLMAHLSGDQALIDAFRAGEDIHRATAAKIFGVPLADVSPEQRRRAKTANFGIIYGISAFGLSQRLDIPRVEAREIIDGYFRSYPGVKQYMERVAAYARSTGYVSTIFGRRRYLPDIDSRNAVARALAERNAINAPIQGSAADIMKIAMRRIFDGLAERGLASKMILQVHDEVVINTLRSEQEEVAALVVEAMSGAADLAVELVVDYGVGENWLDAH